MPKSKAHIRLQTHPQKYWVNTINGIRFTLEDGSWGLIRTSSNKPALVNVVESPT
jgi:phosphomannomutase